jgi:DUF2933 family protein
MEMANGQVTAAVTDRPSCHHAGRGSPGWLGRRRGLVIALTVAAAAAALALGQHWLAVADLVPLLFVLPCAAMMFMCMKGMNHGQQADTARASGHTETPTATDTRN